MKRLQNSASSVRTQATVTPAGVTLSEVVSVMQTVPGVDYVDLDILDSVDEKRLEVPVLINFELKKRVNARFALGSNDGSPVLPAQLLFLSADAPDTLMLDEVTK